MRTKINSKFYIELTKLWMADNSLKEIANKLDLKTISSVSYHIRKLRNNGVNLPKRHGQVVDKETIDTLKNIVGGKHGRVRKRRGNKGRPKAKV